MDGEGIAEKLRQKGLSPSYILLTHGHFDHSQGVKVLKEQTGAKVLIHREDGEMLSNPGKNSAGFYYRGDLSAFPKSEADILLEDGDVIRCGSMSFTVIHTPGHTPGSVCVLVEERRLLLTGDDWNPCTWVFFPEALGVHAFRKHVRSLQKLPFTHVMCSHQLQMYPRSMFDMFFDRLTDDVLRAAVPVNIGGYEHIDTRQANVTDDQILVFDWNKAEFN
jgi:glyoxylase-like metal-dependent hydrolase (beta-lactamase superfamily II)